MPTKAKISSGYMWRLALVAAVCLLYAGWSAWDGFVGYPQINKIFAEFEQFKTEHGENWGIPWAQHAKANGYPENPKPPKSPMSIVAQYVQLAITLVIGLWFGGVFLTCLGKWIASDEHGLSSSWGEKVPYDTIKSLNKTRWENKGIALAVYEVDKIERRMVIDDWKFERQPTDQILLDIEAKLSPDQIVGGKSDG